MPSIFDVLRTVRKPAQASASVPWRLPPVYDAVLYRSLYPDLSVLNDTDLAAHWNGPGQVEGRRAHSLVHRWDFIGLIPSDQYILEIGPFCTPMLAGPHVRYFDVLDKAGLINRAQGLGLDSARVVDIDFVSPNGDLAVVDDVFDIVFSSHAIEHQPCLVKHLRDVARLLAAGGYYFCVVPDKRYCFDHFIAESTIAGVLDAEHAQARVHTLRSVVEGRALITHNDAARHWQGDHGDHMADTANRVASALDEFHNAKNTYIDVHAWQFTPSSFERIITTLHRIGRADFEIERIYPTQFGHIEFWAILKKTAAG